MNGRLGIAVEATLIAGVATLAAWGWWPRDSRDGAIVIPPARVGVRVATPAAPGAATAGGRNGDARAASAARALVPGGELGVLPGPLPFPDQVGPSASGPAGTPPASAPAGAPPAPDVADAVLRGRVLGLRDRPVAQARVSVTGREPHRPPVTVATSARGEFLVTGLGPGPYRVAVAHDDYLPTVADRVHQGEEPVLRLAPAGRVTGFVRERRTRAPVTKYAIDVTTRAGRGRSVVRRTGARFEIRGPAPGPWRLSVLAPGYVARALVLEVPAPDRPGEAVLRDLLVELERGAVVAGTVRDAHGDGVPRATVSVGASSTVTDARGDFRLADLPAGEQLVRAHREGYRDDEVRVTLRSGDETRGVEPRLERPGGP